MITLILWILFGALVGSIAGKLMEKESKGFWANALCGIIGGALGHFLGGLIHVGNGLISGFVISVLGTCLFIFILDKLKNS